MTDAYSSTLEKAKEFILSQSQLIKKGLAGASAGSERGRAAVRSGLKAISRTAALVDFEKALDCSLALERLAAVDGSPQAMAEGLDLLAELCGAAEAAADYGSFLSPGGTTSRIIWRRAVGAEGFLARASIIAGPRGGDPIIQRLELQKEGERHYKIRFQASTLARMRAEGRALTLAYFDAVGQERLGMADILALLEKLEASGDLIQHGPLDLPLAVFGAGPASLPYYMLFSSQERPEDFLAARGLDARVLKRFISRRAEAEGALPAGAARVEEAAKRLAERARAELPLKGELAGTARVEEAARRLAVAADGGRGDRSDALISDQFAHDLDVTEPSSSRDERWDDEAFTEDGEGLTEATAEEPAAEEPAAEEPAAEEPTFSEAAAAREVLLEPHEAALLRATHEFSIEDEVESLKRYEISFDDGLSVPRRGEGEAKAAPADDRGEGLPKSAIPGIDELLNAAAPVRRPATAATAAPEPRDGEGAGLRRLDEVEQRPAPPVDPGKVNLEKLRVRAPIAFKLIGMSSLLIVASLMTLTLIASYFFTMNTRGQVVDSFEQIAAATALSVQLEMDSVSSRAVSLLSAGKEATGTIRNESEILYAALQPQDPAVKGRALSNEALMAEMGVAKDQVAKAIAGSGASIARAYGGETLALNVSTYFGKQLILFVLPTRIGAGSGALLCLATIEQKLAPTIASKGFSQTYVVNSLGELVAHPDGTQVVAQADYSRDKLVQGMMASPLPQTLEYEDSAGTKWLGAFHLTGFAKVGVAIKMSSSNAFKAVAEIQSNNYLIMGMILALAFLVVWFFSRSISEPVRALVKAAKRIEMEDFDLGLVNKRRDEIGVLTEAFNQMGVGLGEKEQIRKAFGQFVNPELAEQAMRGEIKLGGERKNATIFFSDIRSFTAISETLEPEEIVEFLNKYMTRMVECVEATGGFVDKFIGDAIMAVWGATKFYVDHTERAVNAALMMRRSLIEFNIGRGGPKTPIIKIGCGINVGPVTAGQIGGVQKMQFTVIGDPVNLASRIESLNKPFGTDVLVSQDAYLKIKDLFRFQPMKPIMVKGKSEPQQVYAVLGRLDDPACPKSLAEVQAMLGVEAKDLAKVDVDEEEVKYKFIDDKQKGGKAGA